MADQDRAPGADNLGRLRRRLDRNASARAALAALGIAEAIVERFALGLKEPYRSRVTGLLIEDAVAFPVAAMNGGSTGRYAYWPLAGVTLNAVHPLGWGPGDALPYFSRSATGDEELLVVSDPVTMWLLSDVVARVDRGVTIMTRSHPRGVPFAWTTNAFWRGWSRVVLALDRDDRSTEIETAVRSSCDREILQVATPAGETWADLVRQGASVEEIAALLGRGRALETTSKLEPIQGVADAEPVAITGAWSGGRLYYPFRIERRIEAPMGTGPALARYATLVLRSDGEVLEATELPAPAGTPRNSRVCALSDGTRVNGLPVAGAACSWSPASIGRFIEARRRGDAPSTRPLPRLLADVELYLRSIVWLPDDDAYALVALFIAMTHCHRLFTALPLLFVNGPHGSGKSELGEACATLGFNGVVAGHVSAAALVRLAQETRGLVVLDDLERIGGRVGGAGVTQLLKVGYKTGTATRMVADASGGVRTVDLFGPRIVTNTGGVDDILASRMLVVRTSRAGEEPRRHLLGADPARASALRDELHTWAFAETEGIAECHEAIRSSRSTVSRLTEIMVPLLTIAQLAGGDWRRRLKSAVAHGSERPRRADEIFASAMRTLLDGNVGRDLSMAQVALQCALEAGPRGCPDLLENPDALGRRLLAAGFRDPSVPAWRARLHGRLVRIYRLADAHLPACNGSEEDGAKNISEAGAFAFCARIKCGECPYEGVCESTVPGLRTSKNARLSDLQH